MFLIINFNFIYNISKKTKKKIKISKKVFRKVLCSIFYEKISLQIDISD